MNKPIYPKTTNCQHTDTSSTPWHGHRLSLGSTLCKVYAHAIQNKAMIRPSSWHSRATGQTGQPCQPRTVTPMNKRYNTPMKRSWTNRVLALFKPHSSLPNSSERWCLEPQTSEKEGEVSLRGFKKENYPGSNVQWSPIFGIQSDNGIII